MSETLYNVWITKHTKTAKNAGIIGGTRFVKGDWSTGRLRWVPRTEYAHLQENYLFVAQNDTDAYVQVTALYHQKHPDERRPLSGKSYMRDCRVKNSK